MYDMFKSLAFTHKEHDFAIFSHFGKFWSFLLAKMCQSIEKPNKSKHDMLRQPFCGMENPTKGFFRI